jgi:class 3 adenylate cyclase
LPFARRSFYTNDGEEEEIIAESFESATVLFADIAGFTQWSSGRHPGEV